MGSGTAPTRMLTRARILLTADHGEGGPGCAAAAAAAAAIEVAIGTTVTWTNSGGQPHTATARDDTFDTGVLTNGKSGSYTFEEAGTYPYVCTLHENTMQGVVTVV